MMYLYTDNPENDFDRWSASQEAQLQDRPVCDRCHEHIQEDFLYDFGDSVICDGCLLTYVRQFERSIG